MATEPLSSFKCPITGEVMINPVTTEDGHTYEHAAIKEWFERGNETSPSTGQDLRNPNPKLNSNPNSPRTLALTLASNSNRKSYPNPKSNPNSNLNPNRNPNPKTSLFTGAQLHNTDLIPNIGLRNAIEEW